MYFILQSYTCNDIYYNDNLPFINGIIFVQVYMYDSVIIENGK